MTDLSQTETILAELLAFPTVSHLSNLDMIHHLANRLETAGARVDILEDSSGTKANLFATLGPDSAGSGGLVLSGHTDVVPVEDQDWTVPPFALTEKDDLLLGRGSCDMKGFIAAAVAMAPVFAEQTLERPVHFAFTHDEEVGCFGALDLVAGLEERGIRPAMAIVGEPTNMQIVDGHKGSCEYRVRFAGQEGHGSAPDKGVNAVSYASLYVAELLRLADALQARAPADSPFDPPWSTINIGALHGGVASNVIPGKAVLDWEMRPVIWNDAEFVKSRLASFVESDLLPGMRAVAPSAGIETEIIGEIAGLVPMGENAARDLIMSLTGANDTSVVSFGTEAGLFQGLGTHVVVCGPGSVLQAHKPDEFVSRAQLAQCVSLLERLAHRLAQG